jgi:cell division protein FtsB
MVGILTYILFFGDNSIIEYYRYQKEADNLRAQIIECNDSITYYDNLNRLLRTDPETMERIVREQYHMQRHNEDIYIVE